MIKEINRTDANKLPLFPSISVVTGARVASANYNPIPDVLTTRITLETWVEKDGYVVSLTKSFESQGFINYKILMSLIDSMQPEVNRCKKYFKPAEYTSLNGIKNEGLFKIKEDGFKDQNQK